MALIKFSTPPTLAGLFFCLAPAEGAGLFFFGLQRISHIQAFTAAFIPSMQLYSQNVKSLYRALQ
jgi:hypothetical protein|nr:MAG TPA: hypothetical protein [Caudoviricetes sp.]